MLDLLIRNGHILDGTGNPGFGADVGISGSYIVALGRRLDESAVRVIDAEGLFVCPGFVDMHTHSDLQLLADPLHEPKVRQGVTVEVLGQDGLSYAPVTDAALPILRRQLAGWNGDPPGFDWDWRSVGEYLERIDRTGVAVNACYLVPHGTLRVNAMGLDDRAPTPSELEEMKRSLRDGILQGAVGLSSGLTYAPGMYASDDELIELCSVMHGTGAFYCPHHRNYGSRALEEYAACIEIAQVAGVPLHLAHTHLSRDINRGRLPELLRLFNDARRAGIDLTLDSYPYLAGQTYLHALLPRWIQADGHEATISQLADPDLREQVRIDLEQVGTDGTQGLPIDWSSVVISGALWMSADESDIGRSVAEAAAISGKRPVDYCCDLLVAENLSVSATIHFGIEEHVREIMRLPMHSPASDGLLVGERPHPRGWGTFPRILGVYVRELEILSWEEAVRKMTSLPCGRLGLYDRGILRAGFAADIVCFDPETAVDTATYEDPKRYPTGIPYVIVNGELVIDDGAHTGARPGKTLRRSPSHVRQLVGI